MWSGSYGKPESRFGIETLWGIIAIVVAAFFYSASMVAVKKVNAKIQAYASMTGSLIIASICYVITTIALQADIPAEISTRAAAAILYLSIVGSVIGFLLFFYLLKHISATRTSLIALITPGCALILGNVLNNEPLTLEIWIGSALVLGGLLLFEFGSSMLLIVKKNKN